MNGVTPLMSPPDGNSNSKTVSGGSTSSTFTVQLRVGERDFTAEGATAQAAKHAAATKAIKALKVSFKRYLTRSVLIIF